MALPEGLIPSSDRIYVVPASHTDPQNCGCGPYHPWWMKPVPAVASCEPPMSGDDIPLAPKSSADVLDYTLDFTTWLENTGDSLTGDVTVSFPDSVGGDYDMVTVFADVYNTTQVVVMLASGMPRTRQHVQVSVETVQGRVKVVECILRITNDSPATPGPKPVIIPSDAYLNGDVWMVGSIKPEYPLFDNGGVLMTYDAKNPPKNTVANLTDSSSNIGVLMLAQ